MNTQIHLCTHRETQGLSFHLFHCYTDGWVECEESWLGDLEYISNLDAFKGDIVGTSSTPQRFGDELQVQPMKMHGSGTLIFISDNSTKYQVFFQFQLISFKQVSGVWNTRERKDLFLLHLDTYFLPIQYSSFQAKKNGLTCLIFLLTIVCRLFLSDIYQLLTSH